MQIAPATIQFPLSKKQTKLPRELETLKQEMETDDAHATMRESFSLVQKIEYTDVFPAHLQENMVEKMWKAMQFALVF